MYPKLFILKEFYLLILDHIISIHPCELLITKTKESKINELKEKKVIHNNNKKKMDNLHFIPNNILTKVVKELIKYKNDY